MRKIVFQKNYFVNIYMNKQFKVFSDNTQQMHLFLAICLFLIVSCMFIPANMKFTRTGGQLVIIMILGYILYKNFTETRKFSRQQVVLDENSIETATDLKNNILASYVLCGFILLLLLYLIYSLL